MKLQCKTDLMRSDVFSSVPNGKAGSEVIHLYDEYTANVWIIYKLRGHIHTSWLARSLNTFTHHFRERIKSDSCKLCIHLLISRVECWTFDVTWLYTILINRISMSDLKFKGLCARKKVRDRNLTSENINKRFK